MTTHFTAHRWIYCLLIALSVSFSVPPALADLPAHCDEVMVMIDDMSMESDSDVLSPCHTDTAVLTNADHCSESPCHTPPLVLVASLSASSNAYRATMNIVPEPSLSLYITAVQPRPPQA